MKIITEVTDFDAITDDTCPVQVRKIDSKSELYELWKIDFRAYGVASISFTEFSDWFDAFPDGLNAMFVQGGVVGASGVWPVPASWYDGMYAGEVQERELNAKTLAQGAAGIRNTWYISGLVLEPWIRRTRAISILLSASLRAWLKDEKLAFPVRAFALASSPEGEALLKRFGFIKRKAANELPDASALYALDVPDIGSMQQAFRRIAAN